MVKYPLSSRFPFAEIRAVFLNRILGFEERKKETITKVAVEARMKECDGQIPRSATMDARNSMNELHGANAEISLYCTE